MRLSGYLSMYSLGAWRDRAGIKRHVHKEGPLILFGHAKVINGVVSHDVAPVPTAFPEAFKLRIKWTPRIGFAG